MRKATVPVDVLCVDCGRLLFRSPYVCEPHDPVDPALDHLQYPDGRPVGRDDQAFCPGCGTWVGPSLSRYLTDPIANAYR